jgi:hypothetical protein
MKPDIQQKNLYVGKSGLFGAKMMVSKTKDFEMNATTAKMTIAMDDRTRCQRSSPR